MTNKGGVRAKLPTHLTCPSNSQINGGVSTKLPTEWTCPPSHTKIWGQRKSCPLIQPFRPSCKEVGSAQSCPQTRLILHLAKYLGSAQSCPFIQPLHPEKEGGVSTKLPTDSTHLSSSQSNMGSAQSYPPSSSHLAVTILHNLLLASWEPVLDVSSDLLAGSTVSQPNF